MYQAFDKFLNTPTWHTRHPSDEQRFHQMLNEIVWDSEFDPEKMAKYFRQKFKATLDDHESGFALAIGRYRGDAWAVKDFISANRIHR